MRNADPSADAKTAVESGDFRCIGSLKTAPYVIGVTPEFTEKFGVRYIEGMQTLSAGSDDEEAAKLYAAIYNTVLFRELRMRGIYDKYAEEPPPSTQWIPPAR